MVSISQNVSRAKMLVAMPVGRIKTMISDIKHILMMSGSTYYMRASLARRQNQFTLSRLALLIGPEYLKPACRASAAAITRRCMQFYNIEINKHWRQCRHSSSMHGGQRLLGFGRRAATSGRYSLLRRLAYRAACPSAYRRNSITHSRF